MSHSDQQFRRLLLGIGYDARDDHKRITRGPGFHIFGGSEETHERMQEDAFKIAEALRKRGKSIITASDDEFFETARDLGFGIFSPWDN